MTGAHAIDSCVKCIGCGRSPIDPGCRCWVRVECMQCHRFKNMSRATLNEDVAAVAIAEGFEPFTIEEDTITLDDGCPACRG